MADLGLKYLCFKCSSKFYDLKKPKALCPKCGADQADAPVIAAPPPPPPPKRPRVVAPVAVEEPEIAETEEDGEAVASGEDADLDIDADDDAAAAGEELDEPKGEDSYD